MASAPDAASGRSHSVEVEEKFDVDSDTPLPDWLAIPGVFAVGDPEERDLDAQYLDTAELALGRAGYALRRRTGGHDAGWHVKGPVVGGGRVELGWPLGDDDAVPDAIREELAAVTNAAFEPLARIRNARTAYALLSPSGSVVAEFVDDRVRATDEREGSVREWREWEVELGPAGPETDEERKAFFTAVEAAVLAAGARHASSASKLARALGLASRR
ncbi:CYTH domain-containing protein [Microbacterium sp. P01]|uniref:CYTH domain-containing protein n=1 Tax=Microbacterium sp. P01 TaxID=3366261 RepID=UPI00366E3CCC